MTNDDIAIGRAKEALADRIRNLSDKATPEQLKILAEAFSLIAHGPQGGHYVYESNMLHTTNATDYHYTTHVGDPKNSVGFSHQDKDDS